MTMTMTMTMTNFIAYRSTYILQFIIIKNKQNEEDIF